MRHLTRIGCEVPHRSVVFGCRLRASPAVGEVAVDELRVAAFPGHLLELCRAYELLVSGMACRGGCFMYLGVVPGVVYYRWPSSRAAFGFFHCRDVTKSYLQFFYFFFDQGGGRGAVLPFSASVASQRRCDFLVGSYRVSSHSPWAAFFREGLSLIRRKACSLGT